MAIEGYSDNDARTYKGNDIDSNGDGQVDDAAKVKGNDIDSDGDGIVNDSDKFASTGPGDGTADQVLSTDGSSTLSWADAGTGAVQYTTGTYTGDGSTSQSITGLGFEPGLLFIIDTDGDNGSHYSQLPNNDVWNHDNNTESTDQVNSFDSDGFTVDDNGSDQFPNQDTRSYEFIAYSI